MNGQTEIILFCTLRNPETYKKFLDTLGKQFLKILSMLQKKKYLIAITFFCIILK